MNLDSHKPRCWACATAVRHAVVKVETDRGAIVPVCLEHAVAMADIRVEREGGDRDALRCAP